MSDTNDAFADYDATAPEPVEPMSEETAEQKIARLEAELAEAQDARDTFERVPEVDDPVEAAVTAPVARHAVPEHAPKPQDRLPKQNKAREAEANGEMIVIQMFDDEFRIDRSALLTNWDWQMGIVNSNPLLMVKGLLGPRAFVWFSMKAQGAGMQPLEAANQLIEMFSAESGLDKAGN